MRKIARLAFALAVATFSGPAEAGDGGYDAYTRAHPIGSGAHRPTVADAAADLLGLTTYLGAPVGAPANPAPVCPPAVVYRVQRGPHYNAPPSATDAYRVISDCN